MDALALSDLEAAIAHEPDPEIFTDNLAALAALDPAWARELRQLTLPEHWRPVVALDDAPTWRLEPPGQPPRWLAGTALPRRRAEALAATVATGSNVALPTIGAGLEIRALCERLGPLAAAFVCESDPAHVAAVLRTCRLDDLIRGLRCVLLPAGRERDALAGVLRSRPGLWPPGRVVRLPGAPAARIEFVHACCQSVGREISAARAARLAALAARPPAERTRQPGAPRADAERPHDVQSERTWALAIAALHYDPLAHRLARRLHEGAGGAGCASRLLLTDGPQHVHPLHHAEALADFAPAFALHVGQRGAASEFQIGGRPLVWHIHPPDHLPGASPDDAVHLAATPLIARALQRADRAPLEFLFPAPPASVAPDPERPFAAHIVLVADLPNDDPRAYGIVQPTHRTLWDALRAAAGERWDSPEILSGESILRRAERTSRVTLREPELRARLLRIVERGLIPRVVLERITQALARCPVAWGTLGSGWSTALPAGSTALAPSVYDVSEAQWLERPIAAIFAGPIDPLSPGLLEAAARGWPILLHAPDGRRRADGLGGVLQPTRHYQTFAGARELLTRIQALADQPPRAMAAAAAAHLGERHTASCRLRALLQQLESCA